MSLLFSANICALIWTN